MPFQHLYEVRPRKDRRGFDLISDALPFGRLWYGDADAAVGYAKFYSRSQRAELRARVRCSGRRDENRTLDGSRLSSHRHSDPYYVLAHCDLAPFQHSDVVLTEQFLHSFVSPVVRPTVELYHSSHCRHFPPRIFHPLRHQRSKNGPLLCVLSVVRSLCVLFLRRVRIRTEGKRVLNGWHDGGR